MLTRIKRLLKHRWLDATANQRAIPPDMLRRLQQHVAASEQHHTGEIRIYVETALPLSYLCRDASTRQLRHQRALSIFGKLRIWDTANNNGVLIYLLLAERSIELIADRGMNQHVAPEVWQSMVTRMRSAFQAGLFEKGLMQAIDEVSAMLLVHFPLAAGQRNPNELPDAPVLN